MIEESDHTRLNENIWDSRAYTYDKKRYDYFRFMQKRTISLARLHEGNYFLDIGCGTGWAVRYAADLVKDNGRAYGIDISSKMIEKAEESSINCKNVYFCKANAENLPFENNYFDFIICTNSFHHYLNPSKVLDGAYRILKPGGKIYITDITSDGFISKIVNRRLQKREPEHVKFYSTREYRKLFLDANLRYITRKVILYPVKVHIGEK